MIGFYPKNGKHFANIISGTSGDDAESRLLKMKKMQRTTVRVCGVIEGAHTCCDTKDYVFEKPN